MELSRGRIISVAQDKLSATVEVDTAVFCSRCASGKGCGAGVFGSDDRPRRFAAPVVGNIRLHEGDEVRMELAPKSVLHAALIVYGIPLVTALAATGLAFFVGLPDFRAALAAIAGLAAGVLLGRRRLRRANCLRRFTPAITGHIDGRAAGSP
ncbi:MAG: SoxR reducing system RseC family protein [Gammaproteobacteria bacterium]|nr:SoxR reducing system RseC family protein [Gammaproteobacteria bacterium]